MDAEETMQEEAGALSPTAAAASLSTNATAFCIASLLGDSDGDAQLMTEQHNEPDFDHHASDLDDDADESKISGELGNPHSRVIRGASVITKVKINVKGVQLWWHLYYT